MTGLRLGALIVGLAVALGFLSNLAAERLIAALPDPFDHSLDLQPIKAPKLRGLPLRVVAMAVHLPVIGPFLVGYLINDNGYSAVRGWAAAIDDEPVYQPFVPPTAAQLVRARAATEQGHGVPSSLTSAYAIGATTPIVVAQRVLAAVNQSAEEGLGAFVAVSESTLMEAARASSERWRAGRPLGALDGVPVAVKDEIDVRGYATTQGTRFLGTVRQPRAALDSLPVRRLRDAGALIVGKTVMMEIGIGTSESPGNPAPALPYLTCACACLALFAPLAA